MAEDLDIYKKCKACDGTGKITINDETYDSGPAEEVDCPTCNGEGKVLWGEAHEQDAD